MKGHYSCGRVQSKRAETAKTPPHRLRHPRHYPAERRYTPVAPKGECQNALNQNWQGDKQRHDHDASRLTGPLNHDGEPGNQRQPRRQHVQHGQNDAFQVAGLHKINLAPSDV